MQSATEFIKTESLAQDIYPNYRAFGEHIACETEIECDTRISPRKKNNPEGDNLQGKTFAGSDHPTNQIPAIISDSLDSASKNNYLSQAMDLQKNTKNLRVSEKKNNLPEKKQNPERRTRGFKNVAKEPQLDDTASSSIAASSLTSSETKYLAGNMSNESGFIAIPRSLLNHPGVQQAPMSYHRILMQILIDCVWKPTDFNDHGNIVHLLPGQLILTVRDFSEKCGKEISKNAVWRAIMYFEKLDLVGQEVRHRKTIVSIKHPETLAQFNYCSGTVSGTRAGQEWDINKQDKQDKKKKENTSRRTAPVASPSGLRLATLLFESIKTFKQDFKPPALSSWGKDFDLAISVDKRSEESIQKVIKWLPSSDFWRKNILSGRKLREKFDALELAMQSTLTNSQKDENLATFREAKVTYKWQLKDWFARGEYVVNDTLGKELSLNMSSDAFVSAFESMVSQAHP